MVMARVLILGDSLVYGHDNRRTISTWCRLAGTGSVMTSESFLICIPFLPCWLTVLTGGYLLDASCSKDAKGRITIRRHELQL